MSSSTDYTDEWSDLESIMASMIAAADDQSTATANRSIALLDDLASQSTRLQSTSREISTNISTTITNERTALESESSELAHQINRVSTLENELHNLQSTNSSIQTRHQSALDSIPLHTSIANQKIDELAQMECRNMNKLKKHKHELSLHALMTNIKWDYNQKDVLAGEVSVPKKAVHRRFVIEKENNSGSGGEEVEIAEKLWGMIEG